MVEHEMASKHGLSLLSLKHTWVQVGVGGGGGHSGSSTSSVPKPQITNSAVNTFHLYLRRNGKDNNQFSQVR